MASPIKGERAEGEGEGQGEDPEEASAPRVTRKERLWQQRKPLGAATSTARVQLKRGYSPSSQRVGLAVVSPSPTATSPLHSPSVSLSPSVSPSTPSTSPKTPAAATTTPGSTATNRTTKTFWGRSPSSPSPSPSPATAAVPVFLFSGPAAADVESDSHVKPGRCQSMGQYTAGSARNRHPRLYRISRNAATSGGTPSSSSSRANQPQLSGSGEAAGSSGLRQSAAGGASGRFCRTAAANLAISSGGGRRAHSVDALDGGGGGGGCGGSAGSSPPVTSAVASPTAAAAAAGRLSTASSLDLESAIFAVTVERLGGGDSGKQQQQHSAASEAPEASGSGGGSGSGGLGAIQPNRNASLDAVLVRVSRDATRITLLPTASGDSQQQQQQQQPLTISLSRDSLSVQCKRRKLRITTSDWRVTLRHDEGRYLRALHERLAPPAASHSRSQQQQQQSRRSRLQQQRMINSASVDETGGSGGGGGGGGGSGGGGSPRPFKLGLLKNLRTNRLWPGSPPLSQQQSSSAAAACPSSSRSPVPTASGSYGIPLHLCPMGPDGVPLLVQLCCRVLEVYGLRREGIYRVSGNARNIEALEAELSKPPAEMDPDCELWLEHNVVASVLKRFLLQLPDPLIPAVYYTDCLATQQQPEHSGRMLKLHRLLSMMEEHADHPQHKCHRRTLQYLVRHLARVAHLSATNRMRVYNLAMVFAPSLFGQRAQESLAADSASLINLTKAIIVYRDWLFADWQTADLSVPNQLADRELDADPDPEAGDSPLRDAATANDDFAAAAAAAASLNANDYDDESAEAERRRQILSVIRSLIAEAAPTGEAAANNNAGSTTKTLRRCASVSNDPDQTSVGAGAAPSVGRCISDTGAAGVGRAPEEAVTFFSSSSSLSPPPPSRAPP